MTLMFSGDAIEYLAFTTTFETFIKSKAKSVIEQLYFLGQYTIGKTKELMKVFNENSKFLS